MQFLFYHLRCTPVENQLRKTYKPINMTSLAPKPGVRGGSSFLMKIFSNLTIEPAFFIMSVSIALEQIATQQMVVLKSCKHDFNFTEEICNNLQNETYSEENAQVSAELATFNFYGLVLRNVFPAFFAFYLGAWADRFGRKPIFYIFLTATIISQIILVFCAVYFDSKKEWLFLAYVPVTLAGGYAAWILAINSFLADISAPEDRAFRYGMLGLAWRAGEPLGNLAGAYLFEAGGFVCVFSTTVVGTAIGGLVLVIMIWKYQWNPPKSTVKKSAFDISLVLDAFKATFRQRKGPNRKYIMVLIAVSMFTLVPFYGEFAVIGYAYVFTRYKWEVKEFARYSTIMGTIDIVAQAIFIPLIRVMNLNEAWVMSFLFCTITARHMVKAFAYDPWMYYLGSIIDCLGYYAVTINRAMTSLCVSQHDLGKLMAFYSALESLAPIGVGFIYSTVWNLTNEGFIGSVFLVSAGFSVLALIGSFYVSLSLKGKKMQDVTYEGAHDQDEEQTAQKTDEDPFRFWNHEIEETSHI